MSESTDKQKLSEELEELRQQVEARTEEQVAENLETHKSSFMSFIDKSMETIDSVLSGDAALKARQSLDELRVQLALGKAESKEALEEQKQKLDSALHDAETRYASLKEGSNDDFHKWTAEFGEWKEKLQTRMDIAKLQYSLGKAEAKEEMEKKRQGLSKQLQSMKEQLDNIEDKGEEKMEEFTKEISESFSHFKKAVKGLFS